MENNFYIYFHINPVNDEVFYVGKGKNGRAYHKYNKTKFWKNIVNKYGWKVSIIHDNLSEVEAHELEKMYIKKIGRRDLGLGSLVNLSDGGEGVSGLKMPDELRQKMRDAMTGEKNHRYGKKASDETRIKMSNSHKGKKKSEEHIRKVMEANRGKKRPPLTEEHKKKISEGCRGNFHTEESKRKMSELKKGHTVSVEARGKISESLKGNIAWNRGLKLGKNPAHSERMKNHYRKKREEKRLNEINI
jgi:hypothetical protein